jgi:hypothetical protein
MHKLFKEFVTIASDSFAYHISTVGTSLLQAQNSELAHKLRALEPPFSTNTPEEVSTDV